MNWALGSWATLATAAAVVVTLAPQWAGPLRPVGSVAGVDSGSVISSPPDDRVPKPPKPPTAPKDELAFSVDAMVRFGPQDGLRGGEPSDSVATVRLTPGQTSLLVDLAEALPTVEDPERLEVRVSVRSGPDRRLKPALLTLARLARSGVRLQVDPLRRQRFQIEIRYDSRISDLRPPDPTRVFIEVLPAR